MKKLLIIIILMFAPHRLSAQVTIDSTTSASFGSTATTQTLMSVPVSATSNRLLLVCVAEESNTASVSTVAFNTSESLTHLSTHNTTSNGLNHVEFWYLKAPTATTADVVVTFSDARRAVIGALALSNVDQTAATFTDNDQDGGEGASGASTSITLTAEVGDLGVICINAGSFDAGNTVSAIAPTGSGTERWDLDKNSGRGEANTLAATSTSVTLGGSWSAPTSYVSLAVDVHPVTSGSAVVNNTFLSPVVP